MGLLDLLKRPSSAADKTGNKAYRTHAQANRMNDSGRVTEAENLYAAAMKDYREAEAQGCSDSKILTGYAILLMRSGDFAKAKELLVKVFSAGGLSDEDRYHVRINHAVCQWHLGNLDKALEDMRTAESYGKIGLFYNVMGALLVQKARETGDFEEATKFMEEAIDYDEDDLAGLDNLGWLRYYTGDKDGARKAFSKAVKKNPSYSPALTGLAVLCHEAGDDAKAKEHLDAALSVHFPTTSPITKEWAENYRKQLG